MDGECHAGVLEFVFIDGITGVCLVSSVFRFLPPEWVDELPSTNTELLARVRANKGLARGTVLAARTQTAGRGRQQRTWQTEPGRNLTFSFLWRGRVSEAWVPSLAQALSLGIATYIEGEGISAAIKWPNDILVSGRKISGILCERLGAGGDEAIVVAGIGLNVNMTPEEAAKIEQPATSLRIETGAERSVESTLDGLLPH